MDVINYYKRSQNVGRPKKFTNVKQVQKLIDAYFDECIKLGDDNKYYLAERPSVIGLGLYVFGNKSTMWDYEQMPEFSDTIKTAKQYIEKYTEDALFSSFVNGAKFSLANNFGWKEKSESVVTNKTINIEI